MNQVVSKKASQRHEYEVINLGQIAMDLGKYSALFRSVLIMGKTDFNESVRVFDGVLAVQQPINRCQNRWIESPQIE